MTQERLRELLRERVAEETMPDFSHRAWRAARVVRRRHRLGAAAGVVAATVGVSGVIAAVSSTPPRQEPAPDLSLVRPPATPDATYRGVPVWWSPDQHQEQALAPIASPLPDEINLDASQPYVSGELDRAVAAFARGRSVVLRFYDDLSERDTAEALGVGTGTVKSQTHAALAKLRAVAPELAELLGEETT